MKSYKLGKQSSISVGKFAEGGRVPDANDAPDNPIPNGNARKTGPASVPSGLWEAQEYHKDSVEGGRARDEADQIADPEYAGRRIIGRRQDYDEQMTDKGHNRYWKRNGRGPVKRGS